MHFEPGASSQINAMILFLIAGFNCMRMQISRHAENQNVASRQWRRIPCQ